MSGVSLFFSVLSGAVHGCYRFPAALHIVLSVTGVVEYLTIKGWRVEILGGHETVLHPSCGRSFMPLYMW